MEMKQYGILELFPKEDRRLWGQVAERASELQEIRLRAGKPVLVTVGGREYYMTQTGNLSHLPDEAHRISQQEIQRMVLHNCEASLYAYEAEVRQGFLPVKGGHRIGLVGQAVLGDRDEVKTLKNISGVNIRIAHQIFGVADAVLPYIYIKGRPESTLLIAPPGCGKTTLLRDMVRMISDGNSYGAGMNVGVVDERGEIAACHMGIPQNDVGCRTDILDACPKREGLLQLIRSMAPGVIAVDEIGKEEDMQAIMYAVTCGVQVFATIHGSNMADVLRKEASYKNCGRNPFLETFEHFIILQKRNGICEVALHLSREEAYAQISGGNIGFAGMCGDRALLQGAV